MIKGGFTYQKSPFWTYFPDKTYCVKIDDDFFID